MRSGQSVWAFSEQRAFDIAASARAPYLAQVDMLRAAGAHEVICDEEATGAALAELELRRREARQPADRLFERNHFFLAHIFPEQAPTRIACRRRGSWTARRRRRCPPRRRPPARPDALTNCLIATYRKTLAKWWWVLQGAPPLLRGCASGLEVVGLWWVEWWARGLTGWKTC